MMIEGVSLGYRKKRDKNYQLKNKRKTNEVETQRDLIWDYTNKQGIEYQIFTNNYIEHNED